MKYRIKFSQQGKKELKKLDEQQQQAKESQGWLAATRGHKSQAKIPS